MSWLIYKHTNKLNGKVYIGQTKQSTTLRWKNGKGYLRNDNHQNSVFSNAILKYGWENFTHEILENNIPTQEEANNREIFWIKHFNSYIGFENSNGYNMTLGGDTGEHLGYSVLQIDKKTLQIINKFPSTAEAARCITNKEGNASAIRSVCEGKKHSLGGYFWCYEKSYNELWSPKINKLVTPVLQIDDNYEVIRMYDSIQEAVRQGFSGGTIVQCCLRKTRKANGYFWCYKEDYCADWKPAELSFKRNERIYCFEKNTTYSCAKEAAIATGANVGKILRCCNGKERGANGYHFCYETDKENYTCLKTTKKAKKFSNEEISILKSEYPKIGIEVRKFLPTRSECAITQECHRLGIKYNGGPKTFKKVRCVELNLLFNSLNEAAIFCGLKDASSISKCCKGKRETAAGYHWEYFIES